MSRIYYRVVGFGGRGYKDRANVFAWLDEMDLQFPISHLIHGDYAGADKLCDEWAILRGRQPVRCPALWVQHGKKAGPMRNQAMVELRPHLGIAFPGNNGTADMLERCKAAKIQVVQAFDVSAQQAALRISLAIDSAALKAARGETP
ncbi:MAG TPA: SLOG family protein [Acidobacteriaceae bacterium]|nr:SLOG family protein [Acidobacteriaceae bacterium]